MEKYKSLLYREWKITKKFYLLRIVLLLLFTALLGGGMIYAVNVGVEVGGANDGAWLFLLYLLVLFIAAASGEDNGVYKSDVNSGWLKYSWALPVTAHEKAVTRSAFRAIVVLIGTIYMFVSIGVICAITGFARMATVVYVFFWGLDIILIFHMVHDFIIMRAVDKKMLKKMSNVAITIFIVVISIPDIIVFILGKPINSGFENKMDALAETGDLSGLTELLTISDLGGWIGILLLFVILIGGFLLSRKNFERRNA